MTLKKTAVKPAARILFFSLLFSIFFACGELSTSLLSSGGTYQIKALVNGNSLESCSLIRREDKIIPYFAVSVVNDPDLTGLLVYLKNSKGDIIGDRVLYTIDPEDEAIKQETPREETKPEDKDPGQENEFPDNDLAAFGDDDPTATPGSKASAVTESETAGQAVPELPKQAAEKKNSVDTKSTVKKYDTAILLKSFGQEMPYFPLPKNMDIGPYILVFESLGKSNTLSLTEFDIFYLGNVEFRLNDVSMYLPWLSDTRLIPPGAAVMLEAGLDFDKRLNPYVIWYNGKNIISEGNINEGAGNILWKAPEQPGFYSLRVEVFPYQLNQNIAGIFREITIPVSAKASQTGYFFEIGPNYPSRRQLSALTATAPTPTESPELLRWYRFDGSLYEARSAPERLQPAGNKAPRWAAVEQSYGLSAGPDDTYILRPVSFFRRGQEQGGGIFLFHIRPATEETFFSAFFPMLASAGDGVWMDMAMRKNAVTLSLKTKGTSVVIPVNPDYSGKRGFIPIVVEFYINSYRFNVKLSVGEDNFIQSATGGIRLPGVLAGEGRIKLGADPAGSVAETREILTSSQAAPEPPSETDGGVDKIPAVETVQSAVTTVWDEFAVLSSTTPFLTDDSFIEDLDPVQEEARPRPAASLPENETANIRIEQSLAEDEEARPLISSL